ncbi:hypothetical protein SSX86_011209 [Deinandra increscens subsp. villosa]|uniref:Gag-pol polyprotein n=1 Tax=Deinandra increscens subsp. villosa TaxID=3103831 RepID=A0AAP0DDH2_9ASTR
MQATKRHAREAKSDVPRKPVKTSIQKDAKDVTFGEDDMCNVMDPHHDGLVITLYIANHYVKRILIDGGSSVNIIQLEALTKMGIPQDQIVAKSMVLVGFSGETKNTLGEVKLPSMGIEKISAWEGERLVWKGDHSGFFSVGACRRLLQSLGSQSTELIMTWNKLLMVPVVLPLTLATMNLPLFVFFHAIASSAYGKIGI